MLSEVFWSFFLTSTIGCIMGLIRMLYKSKCKSCSLCGITIERDIKAETDIDELEIQRRGILEESNKK